MIVLNHIWIIIILTNHWLFGHVPSSSVWRVKWLYYMIVIDSIEISIIHIVKRSCKLTYIDVERQPFADNFPKRDTMGSFTPG